MPPLKPVTGEEEDKEVCDLDCKHPRIKMSCSDAHKIMGHHEKNIMEATAECHNVEPTGEWKDCIACLKLKAKAAKISEKKKVKDTAPGEGMSIDTTGPFAASGGGTKCDVHIQDDKTPHAVVDHTELKSEPHESADEFFG